MLTERQAIEQMYKYGAFANPQYPNLLNVKRQDLDKLSLNDPEVAQAAVSFQEKNIITIEKFSLNIHKRPAYIDGQVGPATMAALEVARCGHPDYGMINPETGEFDPDIAVPAVGNGNWPRCHNIGNFHACLVYLNKSTMPSFLQPLFDKAWANVEKAYMDLGLKFILTDDSQNHNTSMTWVRPDGGWIGLAILGRGEGCNGRIWSRYDQNYRGGSSEQAIINQWSSLIQHELGHNCGCEHTRGGIMNPSIIPGLPMGTWKNDPSESILKQWFGGEPIPRQPEPPTPPGPVPPGDENTPRFASRIVIPADGNVQVSTSFVIPRGAVGEYDLISTPKKMV